MLLVLCVKGDSLALPVCGFRQKESGYGIGPVLLGFFVFVLVGSSVIQILRTAQMGL